MSIVRHLAEKPLRDERTKNDYTRLSIDLGSADMVGSNIEIQVTGDKLAKIKYDGSDTGTYFTFDHRHAAKVYASEFKSANRRFNKIYLTNAAAQAGKVLVLQLNELEVSEIEPDTKGQLEHLAEIEDAAEAIETDIAALEVLVTAGNVDLAALEVDAAAIEVLLGTIDTDTGNIATDAAAIETLLGTIDADTGSISVDTGSIDTTLTAMEIDLQTTASKLGTIDADTGAIAIDAAAIEVLLGTIDSDTGKIAGSGVVYAKAVTSTVSSAAIEASAKMLSDVVIQNNHATVSTAIGTSAVKSITLAPGDTISFRLVDLATLYVIRVGGANGTLGIIGSEQ